MDGDTNMIEKKVFKIPTIGERYNEHNPLRPNIVGAHQHQVIEYIDNDKFAIVVAYNTEGRVFDEYFAKGLEQNIILDKKYEIRSVLADGTIEDSSIKSEIGNKEYNLLGITKEEYLKLINRGLEK